MTWRAPKVGAVAYNVYVIANPGAPLWLATTTSNHYTISSAPGTGDIVNAVTHMRAVFGEIRRLGLLLETTAPRRTASLPRLGLPLDAGAVHCGGLVDGGQ